MNKTRKSISKRLIFMLTSLVSLAVILVSASMLTHLYISEHQKMEENLIMLARVTGENANAAIEFNNNEDAQSVLQSLSEIDSIEMAAIYTNGLKFAEFKKDGVLQQMPQIQASSPSSRSYYSGDYFTLRETLLSEEENKSELVIVNNLTSLTNGLLKDVTLTVSITLSVIIITMLLALKLHKTITEPVLELAKVARNISENDDYSKRAEVYENDEIGDLTAAFNHMIIQTEKRNTQLLKAQEKVEKRNQELIQERQIAELRAKEAIEANAKVAEETKQRIHAENANRMKSKDLQ